MVVAVCFLLSGVDVACWGVAFVVAIVPCALVAVGACCCVLAADVV